MTMTIKKEIFPLFLFPTVADPLSHTYIAAFRPLCLPARLLFPGKKYSSHFQATTLMHMALVGGDPVVFGGRLTKKVYKYNTGAGNWEELGPLPEEIAHYSIVIADT